MKKRSKSTSALISIIGEYILQVRNTGLSYIRCTLGVPKLANDRKRRTRIIHVHVHVVLAHSGFLLNAFRWARTCVRWSELWFLLFPRNDDKKRTVGIACCTFGFCSIDSTLLLWRVVVLKVWWCTDEDIRHQKNSEIGIRVCVLT